VGPRHEVQAATAPRRAHPLATGVLVGLVGLVVVGGIASWIAYRTTRRADDPPFWRVLALGVAGSLATAGALVLATALRRDEVQNGARLSAPALPADLADEGERVWLEGDVLCPRPRIAPHFGVPCVWMEVAERAAKGRAPKVPGRTEAARVWIEDGASRVELSLANASFHHLERWKTSAKPPHDVVLLPAAGRLSACGVMRRLPRAPVPPADAPPAVPRNEPDDVSTDVDEEYEREPTHLFEDGADPQGTPAPTLVADTAADLPLLVTALPRAAWAAYAAGELLMFSAAAATLLTGGVALVAFAAGFCWGPWRETPRDGAAISLGGALLLTAVLQVLRSLRAIRRARTLAVEAAAALEGDLTRRAPEDALRAAARLEARLRVHDAFVAEHARLLRSGVAGPLARLLGDRALDERQVVVPSRA
jgi:hypothetical protein